MIQTRIGVLRGGTSPEYDVSLKTGQAVLGALSEEKYHVRDILIDRGGKWHSRGMRVAPEQALQDIDVAFNALHGSFGEDGKVQRLLDTFQVPYTGSDALGSAIGMNKHLAKSQLKNLSFKLPEHRVLKREEIDEPMLVELWQTFPQPSFVKPVSGGSSLDTLMVDSFDGLLYALALALENTDQVMIEEYIPGRELTVGVVDGFRNEDLYVLPVVEIIPSKAAFFDYDEKYSGSAQEVCPTRLPEGRREELEQAAREVHKTLGLRDYSRSDFIMRPDGVYFLEVNTLPGLTSESLVPKALSAVGASLSDFFDHILDRALSRR
jgi:D-alanine-D-alanine ligase